MCWDQITVQQTIYCSKSLQYDWQLLLQQITAEQQVVLQEITAERQWLTSSSSSVETGGKATAQRYLLQKITAKQQPSLQQITAGRQWFTAVNHCRMTTIYCNKTVICCSKSLSQNDSYLLQQITAIRLIAFSAANHCRATDCTTGNHCRMTVIYEQ